jgi:hypothetical protein
MIIYYFNYFLLSGHINVLCLILVLCAPRSTSTGEGGGGPIISSRKREEEASIAVGRREEEAWEE